MALLAIATLPLGCQATPPQPGYDHDVVARETFTAHHPAMVLGGPAATTSAPREVEPWWFSRNDSRLNIREDADMQWYQATEVEIRDRLYSRPGRILDTHRRTTRSYRGSQRIH